MKSPNSGGNADQTPQNKPFKLGDGKKRVPTNWGEWGGGGEYEVGEK